MFFISRAFNKFMLYLYWIVFFLKKFLNYEEIGVRIQILKRQKLNTSQNVAVTFSVPKSIYDWSQSVERERN